MTTTLRSLQHELQRFLLSQDAAIAQSVIGDARFPVRERLGVYSHAYTARLAEALRHHYPALAAVLGDAAFESLARDYAAAHPSRSASIRHFGGRLADLLALRGTEPSDVMLADLARWEWALAAAFDGPDAQALTVAALGNVPAEDWPAIQFAFAGSLQRITLRSNALEWWRCAEQDGARPEGVATAPTTDWVIWRTGLTTSFRSLPIDEARMLDDALRGRPFADLCSGLSESRDTGDAALRAASLLKTWCAAGWITGWRPV